MIFGDTGILELAERKELYKRGDKVHEVKMEKIYTSLGEVWIVLARILDKERGGYGAKDAVSVKHGCWSHWIYKENILSKVVTAIQY